MAVVGVKGLMHSLTRQDCSETNQATSSTVSSTSAFTLWARGQRGGPEFTACGAGIHPVLRPAELEVRSRLRAEID